MHPTKPPNRIYVEKTTKQYYLGYRISQKVWKGVWWDKHSSSGLHDQQMEGQDHLKGTI